MRGQREWLMVASSVCAVGMIHMGGNLTGLTQVRLNTVLVGPWFERRSGNH
jgi:hypothetical protein